MTDRPLNAPPIDHPLLVAARYNDAEVEEHGLEALTKKCELPLDDLRYIAEQRALRMVLVQRGRQNEIARIKQATAVSLSIEEQATVEALTPLYLDAILLGWRARELHDAD